MPRACSASSASAATVAWGEAILQTRMVVVGRARPRFPRRCGRRAGVLPVARRNGVPRAAPGAGFAAPRPRRRWRGAWRRRGSCCCWCSAARGTVSANRRARSVETLGIEIERRAAPLLDALRQSRTIAAVEAQIAAAAQMLDILFDDGRAETLTRRLRLARSVRPARGAPRGPRLDT